MFSLLRFLCFFLIIIISNVNGDCNSNSSKVPVDNPVITLYGSSSQYNWTSSIKWNCVYNIKDYKGSFESAQKAAVAGGGGVVYFPAGTYDFKAPMLIESNVIIRGDPTTVAAKIGTKPGPLSPKTIFKCPFGEYIGIFNTDPKTINIGVVNIELDGCPIMLWPGLKTVSGSFNLKTYWYEATDVIGMGKNKIVLSNKIHDVTYKHPDPQTTSGNIWPWSFSTAITCYSDENALVANNLITKSETSMKTTLTFEDGSKISVPYPVDNRYGIDVNQVLLGGVISKYSTGHPCPTDPGKLTPSCAPWYFRRGLVIRNNYVYMNGRVGVSWSGGGDGKMPGSGTQLFDNHVEVASGTTCWSVTGKKKCTGHNTNENRGYNQQGYANNLTMNTGHINRQKAADSGYLTVDGEGILHQASNGNDGLRNIWYKNDLSGGSTGYLVYYKLFNVENNQLIGNTAAKGFTIGAVIDDNHHNVKNNVCKDNTPKCTGM